MAICTNCGSAVPDGAKFCPVCGSPNVAAPQGYTNEPAQWNVSDQQTPPYAAPVSYAKPGIGSIFEIYGKAFGTLVKKPVRLWGLSLLYMVIASLVSSLGSLVPIITLPIILILGLGFTGVLQDGYHGKEVRSEQLFQGFKKDEVVRNGAGMLWKTLWEMIWAFVPVMNIIKYYSYSFVPYIMLTDKEITATEALRKSMRMTNGYKGKMFLADFVIGIGLIVVIALLALLGKIPYLGVLFIIILVLVYIAAILFLPIFCGLVRTAFFNEVSKIYEE